MAVLNGVDTEEFGTKVERLCEFLLDRVDKDGSADVRVIQDLKEDAALLQVGKEPFVLAGLDSHMRGVPE